MGSDALLLYSILLAAAVLGSDWKLNITGICVYVKMFEVD